MRMEEAKELAATLHRSRPSITYFPHRYAAWLLGRAVGEGAPARVIKASPHGRFFENRLVRTVAARAGDGVLTRAALEGAEPSRAEVYPIGVGTWGSDHDEPDGWRGWYQTTRAGANLVLLLYFSRRHDAAYRRLLDPVGRLPAVSDDHPHARAPRIALAWARIDVDLARGEALVEEVQSDWIRDFAELWSSVTRADSERVRDRCVQRYFGNPRARFAGLERYWLRVLAHHRAWWAEATLFAALWLLVDRLRVRRIYYHTHEGGRLRKQIGWSAPPRSLYTDLPERFGFALTREPPRLAGGPAPSAADPPWYRLDL
jgi:hypothetical protein